jgi:hypothetical protein
MSTSLRSPVSSPSCVRTVLCAALALTMGSAVATPFTVAGATTTAQTLGSGETGTVAAGAALTVAGTAVAVTVNGSNATLNNQGTIAQTGSGRAIRDNTGVANLVVNNGSATNAAATIRTADGDVIQMNKPAASVTLNNYGSLVSLNASAGGSQAVDFSAMTGANVLNNFVGGARAPTVPSSMPAPSAPPRRVGVAATASTARKTAASALPTPAPASSMAAATASPAAPRPPRPAIRCMSPTMPAA